MKKFIMLGALNAFLAVALGAFGAHALEKLVTDINIGTWKTGVQYQMFHAVGLIIIGMLLNFIANKRLLTIAGWFMFSGIILFSGSLYFLTITDIKMIGIITPIGGVAFLTSWVLIILAVYKK